MFEFIRGKLIEVTENHVVLDVGGVGYKLLIINTLQKKVLEKEPLFYTSYIVRENSIALYGFLEKNERNLFELLITLSGIGPKTALNILSGLTLEDFQGAILNKNTTTLSKIPGIGKKTAERLIVDLKGKFEKINFTSAPSSSKLLDGVTALMNLGFSHDRAQKAIKQAIRELSEETDLSLLITTALKTKS